MPLMFHLRGHVEVVLAEAMGVARGKLLTEVKASLRTEDPDESDDSLCRDEPLHVKWTTLQKCWTLLEAKRGQNGLPQHLHEVIASTAVYHRDPSVRWRLENPDRKKDYKSNKDMRKHAEKKEYSRMVSNVDASQMERERFVATMKEGMTMPMDFLMILLVCVPAAYVAAKLSAREHWGWVFAAIAACVIVMVEGTLIVIRLSKVDGWLGTGESELAERERIMRLLRAKETAAKREENSRLLGAPGPDKGKEKEKEAKTKTKEKVKTTQHKDSAPPSEEQTPTDPQPIRKTGLKQRAPKAKKDKTKK